MVLRSLLLPQCFSSKGEQQQHVQANPVVDPQVNPAVNPQANPAVNPQATY